MAVETFDPKATVITLGGAAITGYADGTFIRIERDEDAYTKVTGADGTVARVKSNNRGGMVTITLKQTSPSNDVLSAFASQDEKTNTGQFPVFVKDTSGTSRAVSPCGWVKKLPGSDSAKSLQNREWAIDCSDLEMNVGGNVPVSA